MKAYEKEIIEAGVQSEEWVIRQLKLLYNKANDDINEKIKSLKARFDEEGLQSIVYQMDYQKALKKQIGGILDVLYADEHTKLSEYLNTCYEEGFVGTMYSLQKQGIPLILPIDQEQAINAIVHQSKLSKTLYERLGEDISMLKKRVSAEVSRGIANNYSYADIARNLSDTTNIGMNNALRIARTEGHRIQAQSQLDAANKAKEKGADVVKQWDSSLDRRVRNTHAKLDGQIKELDEPFETTNEKGQTIKAQAPSQFGRASEDINCRCVMLQRAKWALDEEELKTLEERAEYYGLDKTKDFEDYKKKYLKASKEEEQRLLEEDNKYKEVPSGDNALSDKVRERVETTEKIYQGSQNEHVRIFDKDGKMVFENSGVPNKVFVEDDKVKGNILTHNHPNSSRLSNADIKNHIVGGAFQTRATTIDGNVFSLTTIDETKLKGIDIDKFTNELNKADNDLFNKGIKRNSKEHMDFLNEQVGKKYGIKFDVEKKFDRLEEFIEPEEMVKKLNIKDIDEVIEEVKPTTRANYKSTKEAFAKVNLNNIETSYAKSIDDRLLDLQNNYPIEEGFIQVNSRSGSGNYGYNQAGIRYSTSKGKEYAVFEHKINYSSTNMPNLEASVKSHTYTYKSRGSKLINDITGMTTIDHEYAHAIDTAYTLAVRKDLGDIAKKYTTKQVLTWADVGTINKFNNDLNFCKERLSAKLWDDLKTFYKLENEDFKALVKNELGTYAIEEKAEFLAEAFTNYRNLPKEQHSDFLKKFGEMFESEFDKVLGGDK